eukprot:2510112-Prymnesium_polylepis.1
MGEDGTRAAKRDAAAAQLAALEATRAASGAAESGEMRKAAQAAWRRTAEFEAALKAALDAAGLKHETAPFEADSQLAFLARTGAV